FRRLRGANLLLTSRAMGHAGKAAGGHRRADWQLNGKWATSRGFEGTEELGAGASSSLGCFSNTSATPRSAGRMLLPAIFASLEMIALFDPGRLQGAASALVLVHTLP